MLLQRITRFGRSEDGGVLVFAALSLAVMLGMVALAFDTGRMAVTQTELQSFADGVALAAAGELDGADDAINRANLAAANIVSGSQTFATGSSALAGDVDASIVFLSDLPVDDRASTAPFQTNDPSEAIYAHVTLTPRQVRLSFARALAALTGNERVNETIAAEAIAGFSRYACDISPLMFCLPSADYTADANIGDAMMLRTGGSGGPWQPGNFGFLDVTAPGQVDPSGPCAGLNGSKLTICQIATAGNRNACFLQRGVNTEPGQKVGIENVAFNTRFDMFTGSVQNKRTDINYAPGPHVLKGLVSSGGGGGQCLGNSTQPSPDTTPFPLDDCHPNCAQGRIGDGNWTAGRQHYVNINYDGVDPFLGNPSVKTRYDYYKAEIANAASDGSFLPAGKSESGGPQCSSHIINDPERRIFIAAGIDCSANPISGSANNVPVQEFFRIFLLAPVGDSSGPNPNFDLMVEVQGSAGGLGASNSSIAGAFRDVVQLYR